jgi:hypothetical protein
MTSTFRYVVPSRQLMLRCFWRLGVKPGQVLQRPLGARVGRYRVRLTRQGRMRLTRLSGMRATTYYRFVTFGEQGE